MSKKNETEWKKAQVFEKDWWGNCANTVWEDNKQMELAKYLGLKIVPNAYTDLRIPMNGQTVLDIGGGPSSILLKCENVKGMVIDPCDYPDWVIGRYNACGIGCVKDKGENIDDTFKDGMFDEVWIYNCLQHTEDPKKIIRNAQRVGKIIRLFEWIETGTNDGHPHEFTKEVLEDWLHGEGKVVNLSAKGLHGQAFYGVFLGDNYASDDTKTKGPL